MILGSHLFSMTRTNVTSYDAAIVQMCFVMYP